MDNNDNKRAFLVGINYRGTTSELGGCINDVLNVRDVLINVYGYNENNILLLTDDTQYIPTKENIYCGWYWLLSDESASAFEPRLVYPQRSNSNPRRLFFQYSGHGTQVRDTNGDEKDGYDEAICPIDCETVGMIIDDKIRSKFLDKLGENDCLVSIIDACHSQSSFDLKYEAKKTSNSSLPLTKPSKTRYTKTSNSTYTATKGSVLMISGCRDFETSADINTTEGRQGALTCALLNTLEEYNYNITCGDLLDKTGVYIKTNRLSNQVPCMSFGNSSSVFSTTAKFTI